jgi:hypothetical protein
MTVANGSFVVSRIPQAQNTASTDRVVILWNAANNVNVGNGSCQVRTIPLQKLVDSEALLIPTNSVVQTAFTPTVLTYPAKLTDHIILLDTNNQNGAIVLPLSAGIGKEYVIKKLLNTADVVTIDTDDVNCLVDGGATNSTSSAYGVINLVMGPDKNYWITNKQ